MVMGEGTADPNPLVHTTLSAAAAPLVSLCWCLQPGPLLLLLLLLLVVVVG
jgi:hypothetical protein